jgi:hypothetical protein
VVTGPFAHPAHPEGSLTGRLVGVQNNFVLGLAGIALLSRPDAYDMLRSDVARFGNFTVPLDQVGHLLTKPGDRDEHLKQFAIVMMRDLVTLSYELALYHAAHAGFRSELEKEPWFNFASVIRNCLSHNLRIGFSKRTRSALPIRWQELELTADMEGKPLPLEFFNWDHAWRLFMDIKAFAHGIRATRDPTFLQA